MPTFSHFFETLIESYPLFFRGLVLSVQLTSTAVFLSLFIGLFFAILKLSKKRIFVYPAQFYITVVRGTPLIVQIFVLYFGLTEVIKLSSFLSASVALAFHNGGYMAEIFRGAILSIDRGQREAAQSLGLSPSQTYLKVIFPQALKRALPSLGNQFIIALKDSSLAAFISMDELFNIATTQGANNFDQMTYLLIVSLYYLTLVLFLSFLVQSLEKRLEVNPV